MVKKALKEKEDDPNLDIILIMDNLKIHHKQLLLKELQIAFKVFYFPAYMARFTSPLDNKIFGELKNRFKNFSKEEIITDNNIILCSALQNDELEILLKINKCLMKECSFISHFHGCGLDNFEKIPQINNMKLDIHNNLIFDFINYSSNKNEKNIEDNIFLSQEIQKKKNNDNKFMQDPNKQFADKITNKIELPESNPSKCSNLDLNINIVRSLLRNSNFERIKSNFIVDNYKTKNKSNFDKEKIEKNRVATNKLPFFAIASLINFKLDKTIKSSTVVFRFNKMIRKLNFDFENKKVSNFEMLYICDKEKEEFKKKRYIFKIFL